MEVRRFKSAKQHAKTRHAMLLTCPTVYMVRHLEGDRMTSLDSYMRTVLEGEGPSQTNTPHATYGLDYACI